MWKDALMRKDAQMWKDVLKGAIAGSFHRQFPYFPAFKIFTRQCVTHPALPRTFGSGTHNP